ncbi:MAG TPA: hypothetical protein VK447_09330 [Myxococcaceae bacterium]|nr:hypothetical protein [Myxococcaceae bacterium]
MVDAPLPQRRWFLPATFLLWGVFAAWCVHGFPPAVDLAAHGAQTQTLVAYLRGDPAVRAVYGLHFPWGYGLAYWVFLPVAFAFNGAVAAKVALWCSLMLFPVSLLALARAFRRSEGVVLLGLPLAFNFSYWYGLLSGHLAQPLAFLTVALFATALEAPRARRWVALNLVAAATFQSHLLAFAAAALVMGVLALTRRPLWPALRTLALSLGLPALMALPKAWSMATRAVTPGPWPATEYNLLSHLNWFFRSYGPEGKLAAVGPLLVTGAFVIGWARRRARKEPEPLGPAVAFFTLALLYVATPKTLSGIFLVSVRLPVLAGMFSLLLVDWTSLARPIRVVLLAVTFFSLGETAGFHSRFRREVAGLETVMEGRAPGRHGYLLLGPNTVLGSKHIYLEHLGQWLTAYRGGVGHNFFTDAEHHPIHALPGLEPARDLRLATPEELAGFDTVLVWGEGPLPPGLSALREVSRAGRWRRLERR